MAPFSSPGKKLLSGCSLNLVNCIGDSKIINPSVIYYSSPHELQGLSFNSAHSLTIKTLSTYQSIWYKHHSTATLVFNICDAILKNAEHNKLTAIVCLDLSAAFDTVNHSILKTVMEHYFGLTYRALQWLSSYISYLTDYSQ